MSQKINRRLAMLAALAASASFMQGCKKDPITRSALNGSVASGFAPKLGSQELIIQTIKSAKREILVATSAISSKEIAFALIEAKERSVTVKVVADKAQKYDKYSSINLLVPKSIPVRINSKYQSLDTNFMVIDDSIVQTGSVSYTSLAMQRNAGNVIVVSGSAENAAAFKENWIKLWDAGDPYEPNLI